MTTRIELQSDAEVAINLRGNAEAAAGQRQHRTMRRHAYRQHSAAGRRRLDNRRARRLVGAAIDHAMRYQDDPDIALARLPVRDGGRSMTYLRAED